MSAIPPKVSVTFSTRSPTRSNTWGGAETVDEWIGTVADMFGSGVIRSVSQKGSEVLPTLSGVSATLFEGSLNLYTTRVSDTIGSVADTSEVVLSVGDTSRCSS